MGFHSQSKIKEIVITFCPEKRNEPVHDILVSKHMPEMSLHLSVISPEPTPLGPDFSY